EERGSWSEAAGAYHSLTPDLARIYRERFDRILAELEPLEIGPVFAGLPAHRRSTRAEAREAQRRAAAERLAAAAPASAPGSLAANAFAPAAGALLNQGMPFLTGARDGLFWRIPIHAVPEHKRPLPADGDACRRPAGGHRDDGPADARLRARPR